MDRLFEPVDGAEPSKRCPRCGVIKALTGFHRDRAREDGRQSYCRECNIEQMIRYHTANAERCRARVKVRKDWLRERNRRLLLVYQLHHPCVDCGERDPTVLDFDHLRDKRLNISALVNRGTPWDDVLTEIAKCEVVCANCHRRRTCVRVNGYRIRMLRDVVGRRWPCR